MKGIKQGKKSFKIHYSHNIKTKIKSNQVIYCFLITKDFYDRRTYTFFQNNTNRNRRATHI